MWPVGHILPTPDLTYGVKYVKGLQWQSLYTDDGESLELSGLFHCFYTGDIFYKILLAGNQKVRVPTLD